MEGSDSGGLQLLHDAPQWLPGRGTGGPNGQLEPHRPLGHRPDSARRLGLVLGAGALGARKVVLARVWLNS